MINIIEIISLISALLCLLSLYQFYIKKRKDISFIIINIWLFFSNLIYFINSIIWKDNNKPINDIYCYISGCFLNAKDYGFFFSMIFITWNLYKCTKKIEQRLKSIYYIIFEILMMIIIPIIFSIIIFIFRNYNYEIRYITGCHIISPEGFINFILHDIIIFILDIISIIFCIMSIHRILTIKKIRFIIENNINFYIYVYVLLFCVVYSILSLIGTIVMIIKSIKKTNNFFNFSDIRNNLNIILNSEVGPDFNNYLTIIVGIILFIFTNMEKIKKIIDLKHFNKFKNKIFIKK